METLCQIRSFLIENPVLFFLMYFLIYFMCREIAGIFAVVIFRIARRHPFFFSMEEQRKFALHEAAHAVAAVTLFPKIKCEAWLCWHPQYLGHSIDTAGICIIDFSAYAHERMDGVAYLAEVMAGEIGEEYCDSVISIAQSSIFRKIIVLTTRGLWLSMESSWLVREGLFSSRNDQSRIRSTCGVLGERKFERRRLVKKAERLARRILREKKSSLVTIANELHQKGHVSDTFIREVLSVRTM